MCIRDSHIKEIIEGYLNSGTEKDLVIVGGLDDNSYINGLKVYERKGLQFIGSIYDKQKLDSLRKGAFAYIHGHSVGGTNPSLLEAMAASCVCICHDNIFNHEVIDQEQLYFRNGKDLSLQLVQVEKMTEPELETCLLYTSDAADERSSVDLGGRRIIKKKKQDKHTG